MIFRARRPAKEENWVSAKAELKLEPVPLRFELLNSPVSNAFMDKCKNKFANDEEPSIGGIALTKAYPH